MSTTIAASTQCPPGRSRFPRNTTRARFHVRAARQRARSGAARTRAAPRSSFRCSALSARGPVRRARPGADLRPRRRPHLRHSRNEGRFRARPLRATTAFTAPTSRTACRAIPTACSTSSTTTCACASSTSKKIALVIDFAETIAPAGDTSGMPAEDRNSLVILKRWAQNPHLPAGRRNLLPDRREPHRAESRAGAESRRGLHRESRCPIGSRAPRFHPRATGHKPLPAGSDVTPEALAELTAGLKRVQLQSLISDAVGEPAAAHHEVPGTRARRT